jgi:hypothetical protein
MGKNLRFIKFREPEMATGASSDDFFFAIIGKQNKQGKRETERERQQKKFE